MENIISTRSKFSIYMQATRPFAFPATVVSVVLAGVYAISFEGKVLWGLYPIIFICAMLFHAAANVISDYFDYRKGVDQNYTFGSSRVLTEGLMTPKEVFYFGIGLLGGGFSLGLILVAYQGLPIFILGLIGALTVYLYCGKPIAFKYFAIGDFMVFLFFGPLLAVGSYMSLTGTFNYNVLYISIPMGLLVAGILHANNTRDIIHDSEAKIKTFAMIIGHKSAKITYYALVVGAYLGVALLMILKIVPIWSLLVFLTVPIAFKNIKTMESNIFGNVEQIAILDVQTAQMHLAFGLVFNISILIGILLK